MQLLKLIIVAIGLLFIFQAEADTVAGSGCSAQNVEALLTQNQTVLSVAMDGFVAEAGRTLGRRLDRKTCQISLPLQVPQGYQVAVRGLDFKGSSKIPAGGMARVEVESFLNEMSSFQTDRVFMNQFDDSYASTVNAPSEELHWSSCGAKTDVKVKVTLLAQSNNRMDSVSASLANREAQSKLQFNLAWRPCGG